MLTCLLSPEGIADILWWCQGHATINDNQPSFTEIMLKPYKSDQNPWRPHILLQVGFIQVYQYLDLTGWEAFKCSCHFCHFLPLVLPRTSRLLNLLKIKLQASCVQTYLYTFTVSYRYNCIML